MPKIAGFGACTRLLEIQLEQINQPKNLAKGCWRDCSLDYLLQRIDEELNELKGATARLQETVRERPGALLVEADAVRREAADVANFLAFLVDVVRLIQEGRKSVTP